MRKFLLLPAINLMCAITLHATVFKNDIPNIINTVVNDSTSEIWISNLEYVQGDTIHLWNGFVICPFESAWCVFVDYFPLNNWGHKCTYLFIDKSSEELKLVDKTLPPVKISEEWTKHKAFTLSRNSLNDTTTYLQRLINHSNWSNRDNNQREQNRTEHGNPHLYAIIIDFCGRCPEYNHGRYFLDCEAMYQAFCNQGYLENNIYVAMPNGSNEMREMRLPSGIRTSILVDLNGDSVSDVRYNATTDEVRRLFEDISEVLTEDDIITIYITGHGDLATHNRYNASVAGMLMDTDYPDSTLICNINALPAGVINLIVQRNMIQYFVANEIILSENNSHAVVLSCDDVEHRMNDLNIPNYYIDEYTRRWTDAVNSMDMATCDLNEDGFISMHEAHAYAIVDSIHPLYSPHQGSNPVCLDRDLTLTGLLQNEPCIQSDLYIKDNCVDQGREPNTSTNKSYISSDIWLEDASGNIVHTPRSLFSYHVCVRIRNRGFISSSGNEVLHVHWTKAVIGGKWPDSWMHGSAYNCNGDWVSSGDEITPAEGYSLPVIPAGEEYIARIPWVAPDNSNYLVCSQFEDNTEELWHYCLLARLYEENDTPGEDMVEQAMNTFVLNSNNVAARNITIIGLVHHNTFGSIVGVVAPYTGMFSLEGRLYSCFEEFLNGQIAVTIYLDDDLRADWSGNGQGFIDLGDRLEITTPIAPIQNIYMEANRLYTIKVEIENGSLPGFAYDITLHDEIGRVLGGESFQYTEVANGLYQSPSVRHGKGEETEIDNTGTIADVQRIFVINALGQIVVRLEDTMSQIDLTGFPTGMYSVVVEYAGKTKAYKVIW